VFDLDQPGQAVHQYPGLAAAGPCQDQYVTVSAGYRLTLRFIQLIEQMGNIHY
jgi:hypothetical protein